jgi:hypothetical protein
MRESRYLQERCERLELRLLDLEKRLFADLDAIRKVVDAKAVK